ncbi:hypothetical protein M1563_01105 [Patescibacteria group bacterium]|nr:hypothetical protein [Patescibacteria group bacterium]
MFKFKILSSILLTLITILFFSHTVQAASLGITIDTNNYKAPQHSDYTLINLEHSIVCEIAGFSILLGQNCVGYEINPDNTVTPKLFSQLPSGGALGGVNSAMVAMYTNPAASTGYYLAYVGNNLGLVKPAYAANASGIPGQGSDVLFPVLKLWVLSRNIAYAAFILIFVIVGFMIMFRQKINPQTVITAQQALPGLAIGLVLVTFSYLIASVLVDLSFVVMQVIAALFDAASVGITNASDLAQNGNAIAIFWSFLWSGVLGNIFTGFAQLLTPSPQAAQFIGSNALGFGLGPVLNTLLPNFTEWIGTVISQGTGYVIGGIVTVIVIIAFLIQMLRLIWGLISAYITILVMTILGPVIIMFSSIPGRSGVISFWWKTILANVMIFPAVFAAFLFASSIVSQTTTITTALPLMGGLPAVGSVDLLKAVLGLGIMMGTPAIPNMVKQAFGIKDVQGLPQAAVAGFMGGIAAGRTGYGGMMRSTGLAEAQEGLSRQRMSDIGTSLSGSRRETILRWLPRSR